MDKYLVFGESSNKYYTTDGDLIKRLKKCNVIDSFSYFVGIISLLSFIGIFVNAFISWEYQIQTVIFCIAFFLFTLTVAFFISSRAYDKRLKVYDLYYQTLEYKEQFKKYCRIEQSKKDKKLHEKAKGLVEAYEILNNKKISKEQKIQLIKKYILKGYI